MAYEPLHHKYRPQTFSDLVGQETIALTLSNALSRERIAPAYLFTGPRGTGKTSSARILAKSLNCLNSNKPTPNPCGKCEACLAIAKGSALDVMEIDAASNTGVDNIREIIERSRFAPVQCRYKIYVVDECLTGDSLVKTSEGLMQIDNPDLKGKQVLSYNEKTKTWEYKEVLRWLERGTKETLFIKTGSSQISCTANHLIRTETGWIEARNVKEGMKIFSPVSADAERTSTNMERMDEYVDSLEDISSKETNTEQNLAASGYKTYSNIPSLQWNTNLEKVESVSLAGYEKVYDLEVADNHNFVANDLLVHNCHMLSTAAFNALLKTLEEPPPQVVFILATTDPQRVLSTIISRCQRFDYRRIPLGEMTAHLKYIADAEKIAIADDALTLIAQIANGGLRDAESLLDQLSLLPETITVAKVWDLVGAVPEQDLLQLLQAINHNDSLAVLQQCRSLLDRGREPLVVLQNLASFYLNLLIAKASPRHAELTTVTETCWQQLCSEAANWQTALILRGQQQLKEAETQLKRTTQPRLWLEVTLLGLLPEAYQAIANKCNTELVEPPTAHNHLATAKPPQVSPQADISSEQNKNTSAAPPASPQSSTHRSQVESPVESPPSPPQTSVAQSNRDPQTVKAIPASTVPPETPAAVAPSPHQDPVANQEIWSKVVSCLQPPTTQALLKQQCHLVSFDGSSAIVGISSAKLQKLNQGKVPNIEAAFVQVCQRLVKVQLEVANPKDNPGNDLSFIKQSVIAPPTSSPKQSFAQPLPSNAHNAHNAPTIPPEKEPIQPQNSFSRERTISELSSQPQKTSPTTSHPQAVSFSQDISVLTAPAIPTENNLATPTAELSSNQNYADDDLQRAIDNLTQSFEGEVVQFDNNSQAEFLTKTELSESEIDLASLERRDANNYNDDW